MIAHLKSLTFHLTVRLAAGALVVAMVCFLPSSTSAQQVPGGIDTGGVDTGGNVGGGLTDFAGQGTQNNFGANNEATLGALEQFGFLEADEAIPDDRNTGFVGSVGEDIIDRGFVGQSTVVSGGAASGTIGGGTNGNSNPYTAPGGQGGQGGQGFNAGAQNGLVRRSIRTRLRYDFSPRTLVQDRATSNQANSLLRRIPVTQSYGNGVSVSIANRTATITGFVQSAEQGRTVERQLRLQPGVYRVVNQLQIAR